MTARRMTAALAAASMAACMVASTARGAAAQSTRTADSLLAAGSLARAESIYYAAVRARPHDAIARWALGRYLVSRGALRVGATLFEESLQFGGEPAIVGHDLASVYLALGEYGRLANLASADPAERQRAAWLAAHGARPAAPDSVVVAVFHPSSDAAAIGTIPIRVDGRPVNAVVSAAVQGIIITDTGAVSRSLHRFRARQSRDARSPVLAAADSVAIGGLSLTAVPVVVDRLENGSGAEIGLDLLARFAPTFDPLAERVVLRANGAGPRTAGERFDAWTAPSDLRIARAGVWTSVQSAPVARLLGQHRWMLDGRHGQLIVEP